MSRPRTSMEEARLRAAQRRIERERELPRQGRFTSWSEKPVCHLTTTGRRTGQAREKWWILFAPDGDRIFFFEEVGRQANWIRNIEANAAVTLRVAGEEPVPAVARIATGDDEARGRLLLKERMPGELTIQYPDSLVVVVEALYGPP